MSGVLHVITGLGLGGAESVLTRTAIAAQTAGARRQIVVSLMDEGVYGRELCAAGVELHCLRMRRGRPSPGALMGLIRLLRQKDPDTVMSWLYHADLIATCALFLSGLGLRRLVWNIRCADMDLSGYSRWTRWTVSMLARLSSFPAAVAANSRVGRTYHEKLGYRPRRWIELSNGFDLDRWKPDEADRRSSRAELGVADEEIAVGLIARVDPMKDHATFFAAAEVVAAARPEARFILIGKDTEHLSIPSSLRGRLVALSERNDVPVLMRALDIAVLSSRSEGFPNVVAEAMASGVPCVVTDAGDAAEIVGQTGQVVPRSDPEALAHGVLRLAGESWELRRERGEAARRRIAEKFAMGRVLDSYHALWDEVASQTRPQRVADNEAAGIG